MEDSPTAVEVRNLSKRYFLGSAKEDSLKGTLSKLFKFKEKDDDVFWALKNVNFDIGKGDVVAIIGKNGAGKSTLLKILSQITKPSEGKVVINGRVASLLEVGTGFHPELTGRENIFLNGTILGMTKQEVKNKFDQIVDFSGVRKFIDTPVKHYSSGMYVRLAFAVAAHLEPEILIIDEVLAVGDAEFQKKCLGKMREVANKGRTVLFVSHNMTAVKSLCEKGIFLKDGRIFSAGDISKVVGEYMSDGQKNYSINKRKLDLESDGLKLNFIELNTEIKTLENSFDRKMPLNLSINYENLQNHPITFTIKIKGDDGRVFLTTNTGWTGGILKSGQGEITMHFPEYFFSDGSFSIDLLAVKDKNSVILNSVDTLQFSILPEVKSMGSWMGKDSSYIKPHFTVTHK